MSSVTIENQQDHLTLNAGTIRELAERLLDAEGQADREASIILIDNTEMARLHMEYMGIEGPTDVLTFPYDEAGNLGETDTPLGDVFVCCQRAILEAKERGLSPEEEALRYVVHGLLHLCGYRDDTPEAKEAMWDRQEEFLSE